MQNSDHSEKLSSNKREPKYRRVAAALLEELQKSGGRLRKTQQALAEEHGVNRLTVRHAIDWLERERLIGRISGRACALEQTSKPERTDSSRNVIGFPIWANSLADLDVQRIDFRLTSARGARMELQALGYDLDVQCVGPEASPNLEAVQSCIRKWQAVILEPMEGDSLLHSDHPFQPMLQRTAIIGTLQGVRNNSVCADMYSAAEQAVNELARAGAKRILYTGREKESISHNFVRIAAAEAAAERHPDLELICCEGGYFADETFSCVKHFFLEGGRCDGILATSIYAATGALRALWDLRYKVPQDVQLVALGGSSFFAFGTPRPTAVWMRDPYALGREAARMAVALVRTGGTPQPNHLVPVQLIRGDTIRENPAGEEPDSVLATPNKATRLDAVA